VVPNAIASGREFAGRARMVDIAAIAVRFLRRMSFSLNRLEDNLKG
jgi:hypothetical protein